MPVPTAKTNLIHQQLLSGLVANKQTFRTETRGKKTNKGWTETEVQVAVATLAGNVTDLNVERAARRWAR
jgi:hypothetical protein